MKGPRPLNADNQIPTAEVIWQQMLLTFVNGETPHRGRHHCRSNTVQPGLQVPAAPQHKTSHLATSPKPVHLMQTISKKRYYSLDLLVHDVGSIAQTLRMASALW